MPAGITQRRGKQIGYFDIVGQSHLSDFGATFPDWGAAHKMDGFLQPAIYDNIALGGSVAAWHNSGNGASGDGGWAHVANEMPRDECITGFGKTTTTANTIAGATVHTVADRSLFTLYEYVVVGRGSTTEIVQVAVDPAGATGAGTITTTACANAHTSGDAFYHAVRNQGYLPKSQLVALAYGTNDLSRFGPYAGGTFGTTPGATRGLGPTMHAIRYVLAHLRCAVVYPTTHPIFTTTGSWTTLPWGSTASYPPIYGPGGQVNGSFIYATANASTVVFSTAPDFPGGTVDLFFASGQTGSGGLWDVGVTGATTRTVTNALDCRNMNAVDFNDGAGLTTGKETGLVYRLTALNAGVNTITITMTANTGAVGTFLGCGMEATQPPAILVVHDPRMSSGAYAAFAKYALRTTAGTATVSAASTTVTVSSAFVVGTTGTAQTAVYPGDTITVGFGLAGQETRRIVTVTDTTHVVVDAAFVNAHTAEAYAIGAQDADLVGGGYVNPADTQGKISVPGLQGQMRAIIGEFDSWVSEVNTDVAFNGAQTNLTIDLTNFIGDGVHFSDKGQGIAAAEFARVVDAKPWTAKQLSQATVGMRRTFNAVYGELGVAIGSGQPTNFANGWSNYYPVDQTYPRCGYYKDMRTRQVDLQMAVYNGAEDTTITTLPLGYRPEKRAPIFGEGPDGPATLSVFSDGTMKITSGWAGPEGPYVFTGDYVSGG